MKLLVTSYFNKLSSLMHLVEIKCVAEIARFTVFVFTHNKPTRNDESIVVLYLVLYFSPTLLRIDVRRLSGLMFRHP